MRSCAVQNGYLSCGCQAGSRKGRGYARLRGSEAVAADATDDGHGKDGGDGDGVEEAKY